jgi:hypothetical protein
MVRKSLNCVDSSLPLIKRGRSARARICMPSIAKKHDLKNDITHTGVKLYNSLPDQLRENHNDSQFKRYLKGFILERTGSLLQRRQFSNDHIATDHKKKHQMDMSILWSMKEAVERLSGAAGRRLASDLVTMLCSRVQFSVAIVHFF